MKRVPILWIDNDPAAREIPTQITALRELGIHWADSGAAMIDDIGSGKFGLVIVDERAPRTSAADILAAAAGGQPPTPVILTTAEGSVRNAVSAMQAGAADYLLKPFSADMLWSAIQRFHGGRHQSETGWTPTAASTGLMPTEKEIITQDPQMDRLLKMAANVAPSNASVLILGESGTGKELLASFIHRKSRRAKGPFVAMNCAALPDTLAESELFGHEKGAFTGAIHRKTGKFELAHGGTLMLDEISEMPLGLQAKLLRVLQERRVDRVGGREPVAVDVRVVAASNQDLTQAVNEGRFREDLFYRLNVIPLTLPPLRQRKADIGLLAEYFMQKYCGINGRSLEGFSKEALDQLHGSRWRGNIRELENVMERAVLICTGDRIRPEDLMLTPVGTAGHPPVSIEPGVSVREMEQALIASTLQQVNGNRTHAAEMLGISIRTLRNKLREYKEKDAA